MIPLDESGRVAISGIVKKISLYQTESHNGSFYQRETDEGNDTDSFRRILKEFASACSPCLLRLELSDGRLLFFYPELKPEMANSVVPNGADHNLQGEPAWDIVMKLIPSSK